ncbi:MAG: hypothetical protein Q7J07_07580, partial [Pelolinea sp.]|nr:hypothetical protein [Pelolinea sp.]
MLDVYANITGIAYTPTLCSSLREIDSDNFSNQMQLSASSKVLLGDNEIALSWWVSPKRTRSYPYARVYDTLQFAGKKATVIPIFKDEGFDGDRDFLQWDTISLMSLINVYVIISYYDSADKSTRYENKI